MALEQAKLLENGLTAANGYTRIIEVRVGDRRGISISVNTWTDSAARQANKPSIHGESHRFDFDDQEVLSTSIMEWAYGKLKLLDEYSASADV